jgi:hypothetical protein
LTPRTSRELKPSLSGVVEKAEIFYMRIGTLRLRQRWIDQEVSPSLTLVVGLGIAAGGFLVGFWTSKLLGTMEILYWWL